MTLESLQQKLKKGFSESYFKRFRLICSEEGLITQIMLDVHGLSCQEVKELVEDIIMITGGHYMIEVIHGYRNGTKIRDMLRKNYINSKICYIDTNPINRGVTYLHPMSSINYY